MWHDKVNPSIKRSINSDGYSSSFSNAAANRLEAFLMWQLYALSTYVALLSYEFTPIYGARYFQPIKIVGDFGWFNPTSYFVDISVGTPPQPFEFAIDFFAPETYVIDNSVQDDNCCPNVCTDPGNDGQRN